MNGPGRFRTVTLSPRRTAATVAGACVLALTATACGSQGIYSVPLPGGPSTGDHPMTITADFGDVLDLVPQSVVKVNGVEIGSVKSISLAPDGWTAQVKMTIKGNTGLPQNSTAALRKDNLLGEKYIELDPPATNPSPQKLQSGDVIPLARTTRSVTVEEVFGALSLLLNGGGFGQVEPIVREVNKALGGRTERTRDLLHQFDVLVQGLNQQSDNIQRAIDGLGTLTKTVNGQRDEIAGALNELPQGIDVLKKQEPQFIDMLNQLNKLGQVGTDVVNKSKENLISDLRDLRPTIDALAKSTPDLVKALPILPTFPIPDEILPAIKGNSANVMISLDLRLGQDLQALGVGEPNPVYVRPYGPHNVPVDPSNPYVDGNGPRAGWPTVSLLPPPPNAAPPVPLPAPINPFDILPKPTGGGNR